jgi:predicted CXXCH cytochrome family protein
MRTSDYVSRLVAAVGGCAAVLVFFVSGPATAGQGELRTQAGYVARVAQAGKEFAVKSTCVAMDNSATCGKCHSTCENGRNHLGVSPIGEQGSAELPLDAEGCTTCITCHDSRRHEVPVVSGAHLRISNLRRELCLACHRQDQEAGPRIEIVSPLERAVVRDERLALIGRASRLSGSELTVRLNGSEFHLHVREGEFSTWLNLQDGINRIEIAQEERLLWSGEVFHGESSLGGYKLSSSGHRTGNREQCLGCHLKNDDLSSGVMSAAPTLCYGCHDRIDDKRYVHGPLAVGDCLVCHDPHRGYGAAHLRQEQPLLCGNCHAARENSATVVCNASGKACVDCHDPHQSDTRYLLKGPQYTMR